MDCLGVACQLKISDQLTTAREISQIQSGRGNLSHFDVIDVIDADKSWRLIVDGCDN